MLGVTQRTENKETKGREPGRRANPVHHTEQGRLTWALYMTGDGSRILLPPVL